LEWFDHWFLSVSLVVPKILLLLELILDELQSLNTTLKRMFLSVFTWKHLENLDVVELCLVNISLLIPKDERL